MPLEQSSPAGSARGTTSSDKRSAWRIALISLGLALAIFAVYARVGDFGFVDLDDRVMVQANSDVKEGLTLGSISRAFHQQRRFLLQLIISSRTSWMASCSDSTPATTIWRMSSSRL